MPGTNKSTNQIEVKISRESQRQFVILAAEAVLHQAFLQRCLDFSSNTVLVVSNTLESSWDTLPAKQVKQYLGRENHCVIYDTTAGVDVDAFASISNTVVGGGLFILLMPPHSSWSEKYPTLSGQRFLSFLDSYHGKSLFNITSENDLPRYSEYLGSIAGPVADRVIPTGEQLEVVRLVCETSRARNGEPVVITADRGRGKSASLGMACAELLKSGTDKIAITAPRLKATDTVFKHAGMILSEATGFEQGRGSVRTENAELSFYAPDALLENSCEAKLLIIDEAAGIPVPVLKKLVKKYPLCIFATTVHGYEGTGRGFQLRFLKWLKSRFNHSTQLELKHPVRWSENDPLEKWMFDWLCLDAELPCLENKSIQPGALKYARLNKTELATNDVLLKKVFALLVLSHYRTRPSDLNFLLDEEQASVYIAFDNDVPVAVALVGIEGSFSPSLSTSIYRGERRPSGHLLAQSLTYHCGIEHAATLSSARIMRIAVHPECQAQGIGHELVRFIAEEEKKRGHDILGTSFGLNQHLFRFWATSGFELVRIGFTREQTSGEHSALMITPLSKQGQTIEKLAIERFQLKLPYWKDDILSDLSPDLVDMLTNVTAETSPTINALEQKQIRELEDYLQYSRSYELSIDVIQQFLGTVKNINDLPSSDKQFLDSRVRQHKSWKEVAKESGLSGKNEAIQYFKTLIQKIFASK